MVIPMDETQKNHLKSYGVAFKALSLEYEVDWMLNYQGGAFTLSYSKEIENLCRLKGVSYYLITPSQYASILEEIDYMDVIKIDADKFPELAVKFGIMSVPTLCFYKDGLMMQK